MKKKWLLVIGAVVLLIVVVAVVGAAKFGGPKGTKVRTQKVERGDLISTVTCNGKIEARRKVDLSANVPGQIVNLAVREGETVTKGEFLLQIDRTNLQAQYDSSQGALDALLHERDAAHANVDQAKHDLDRARVSLDSGLVSQADYDRAKTTLDGSEATLSANEKRIDQAKAMLAGARDTLGKTTITAPISGVISRLAVEEGEVAVIGTMNNPGTVLLTISDLSEIDAVMEVDETDIPTIRLGQNAKITIDAYPNKEFEGEVTEVGSSPIQKSLSGSVSEAIDFEVKIRMKTPPEGLRPGLSVAATIRTGERKEIIAVPLQALVIREKDGGKPKAGEKPKDEEGVFIVRDGKVTFGAITTGMTGELAIEILSGLKGQEEIVTGPFKTLRELKDGEQVIVDNSLPKVDGKEGQ